MKEKQSIDAFTLGPSIHFIVNSILKWDKETSYFLSSRIFRVFELKNKNRLKNLFKKFVFDRYFLAELEKVVDSNFINISGNEVVLLIH